MAGKQIAHAGTLVVLVALSIAVLLARYIGATKTRGGHPAGR